jgi:L-serine dehydratase
MAVSVFDIFTIGIGPSSSHTVGPMRAARMFVARLAHEGVLGETARIRAELFGSLGATGQGHGSDKAVILGLLGHEPDTVDVDAVPALAEAVQRERTLVPLLGFRPVTFEPAVDLVFNRRTRQCTSIA